MSEYAERVAESGEDLATCPYEIDRVAMWHRWDQLTFLHWPYDPSAVQKLLPPGLKVETFDGEAWVGLVPFIMEVRSRKGRTLAWPFHFPETNVRTYVTGPTGEPGVWFFSLDSSRLGAVPVARASYRVRYFWSQMSASHIGESMTYVSRRRWPKRAGAYSTVEVEIGEPYRAEDLSPLDHYLTARWTMYGHSRSSLLMAHARHDPWPLHRATVRKWDDGLVASAGLPPPTEAPLVHWSPGVDVAIGYPRHPER